MSVDIESPYLTSDEVMAYLRISRPTLERLIKAEKLKFYTVGNAGDRRYLIEDVRAALDPGVIETERRKRMQLAVAVNRGELTADEASA